MRINTGTDYEKDESVVYWSKDCNLFDIKIEVGFQHVLARNNTTLLLRNKQYAEFVAD